jgi:hypothetical protein
MQGENTWMICDRLMRLHRFDTLAALQHQGQPKKSFLFSRLRLSGCAAIPSIDFSPTVGENPAAGHDNHAPVWCLNHSPTS